MKTEDEYIDGITFHTKAGRVYEGGYEWAVNKKRELMAKVLYYPAHENLAYEDERRGKGKDFATWIFSEEEGLRENLFATNFELMIDATLEPDASIGLHHHNHTEEIYYIISGSICMTTVGPDGAQFSQELWAGDAHLVRLGQAHYGTAGPEGARFVAVAIRKSDK